jgi:hypothetical protein
MNKAPEPKEETNLSRHSQAYSHLYYKLTTNAVRKTTNINSKKPDSASIH